MTRIDQAGTSAAAIPRVSVGWIFPFLEILDEIGLPYLEILELADLPTLGIDDPAILVPTSKIYDFVTRARRESGLKDLGLRAGQRLDLNSILPDTESTWARPGVFRSIRSFIQVALDSSSNVDLWIESRPGIIATTEFFYLGTFGPDHPAFPTVEQFMVTLMVRLIRHGAGPGWNPDEVNFRASSVPEEPLRRIIGEAVVRCSREVTSVVFPAQRFQGHVDAIPARGSSIWRRHRRTLERTDRLEDLIGSLRLILPAYLPDGSPGIGRAAKLAGMSVRSLQRRLREQGLSYSELLEGLRHDLAIYYLRDPRRTAADISRELGYRDPAIFTRAFRRWTGTTPTEFRRNLPAP